MDIKDMRILKDMDKLKVLRLTDPSTGLLMGLLTGRAEDPSTGRLTGRADRFDLARPTSGRNRSRRSSDRFISSSTCRRRPRKTKW